MERPATFPDPVFVTKPMLPPLESYVEALHGIWERRWFTNDGTLHLALEQSLVAQLRVPYLVLVNNGTMALLLALKALDVSGEVITTPFTFPATTEVVTWSGGTPVFADIDDKTLTLDPDSVERAISPRTSAILAVHVYGIPCDVDALGAIATRHGLKLIYDGAHAFGTERRGESILGYGDATTLSFHATKLFHTAEGGGIVTRSENLKRRLDSLRNFGLRDEKVVMPGINGKLNELQAALGLANLAFVAQERFARGAVGDIYRGRLSLLDGVTCVTAPPDVVSSDQYFAIRIHGRRSRDELFEAFKTYNVFTRRYFYPLCSSFEFYRDLPSALPANLPNAHRVADEVLCLPFYGSLGTNSAERICDIITYEMRR